MLSRKQALLILMAPLVIIGLTFAIGPALFQAAWAQTPAPPLPPVTAPLVASWGMIIAALINAVGTMLLVKGLATVIPWLRSSAPAFLPIVAGAVGPGLAWVQNTLAQTLGVPISLGIPEIMAMFTGASAIAISQVIIQRKRQQMAASVRRMGGASPSLAEHAPI